jgi:hypothetical protein
LSLRVCVVGASSPFVSMLLSGNLAGW